MAARRKYPVPLLGSGVTERLRSNAAVALPKTKDEIRKLVHDTLVSLLTHEVEESLVVEGVRYDPHLRGEPVRVGQVGTAMYQPHENLAPVPFPQPPPLPQFIDRVESP